MSSQGPGKGKNKKRGKGRGGGGKGRGRGQQDASVSVPGRLESAGKTPEEEVDFVSEEKLAKEQTCSAEHDEKLGAACSPAPADEKPDSSFSDFCKNNKPSSSSATAAEQKQEASSPAPRDMDRSKTKSKPKGKQQPTSTKGKLN